VRIVHLADLHIGIRMYGFSLLEDQAFILEQILEKIEQIQPEVVLIAGDVYDKAQPSSSAVTLLDNFFNNLLQSGRNVLVIPGNHDSPERLSFGSSIFKKQGLHIAGPFAGSPEVVTLNDSHGEVDFVLLPFLRPATVRPYATDSPIDTAADAVQFALRQLRYKPEKRYVLLSHQFVVVGGQLPLQSESETVYAGGIESVDISLFDKFSYVALGHLHKPQAMGSQHIRYAGSPLKYSFTESKPDKYLLQIDLSAEGEAVTTEHPLRPLHDVREIKGKFHDLMAAGAKMARDKDSSTRDYLKIVLTDEDIIADPLPNLRQYFPNIMQLKLENISYRTPIMEQELDREDLKSTTPEEMFARFYYQRTNKELNAHEKDILHQVAKNAGKIKES